MSQKVSFHKRAEIPVVSALMFALLYLTRESIWLDEAYSISFANLEWPALWLLVTKLESNMILYHYLLKVWIGVFGDSEFAVRSLSAILAIPAVAFTYAIGRHLYDTKTASIASLLLATNAFFIYYAQEASGYSLLLSLTTLSMYLYILAMKKREVRFFVWLGLVNALILYVHLFGAFIMVAQVISFLAAPKEALQWKRIILSFTIAAVLAIPLSIPVLGMEANPWAWASKPSLVNIYYAVKALAGGGKLVVLYFLGGVASLVFVLRTMVNASDGRFERTYLLLLLWFVVPIACLYLLSLWIPAFQHRYLVTTLPALTIIVAFGTTSLKRKNLELVAVTLLLATSVYTILGQYQTLSKRDWRTAADIILTNSQVGDAVLFYGWMSKYPFEYYYRREHRNGRLSERLICVWPSPFLNPDEPENVDAHIDHVMNLSNPIDEQFESLSRQHDRLWVVLAMDKIRGMGLDSEPIIASIEKRYTIGKVFELKNITIIDYRKAEDHAIIM